MSPIALKRKDSIRVCMRLVEVKLAEVEEFDLHRVSNELVAELYFDNGVVAGHVVEYREVVGLLGDVVNHVS
jgi:hypothetical protein